MAVEGGDAAAAGAEEEKRLHVLGAVAGPEGDLLFPLDGVVVAVEIRGNQLVDGRGAHTAQLLGGVDVYQPPRALAPADALAAPGRRSEVGALQPVGHQRGSRGGGGVHQLARGGREGVGDAVPAPVPLGEDGHIAACFQPPQRRQHR